jgi:hypothetical protein
MAAKGSGQWTSKLHGAKTLVKKIWENYKLHYLNEM